jgi:hypothetical protein
VVAWDVAERKNPAIAADLVNWGCLRERISKRRQQPLILHVDNGNAMRAADAGIAPGGAGRAALVFAIACQQRQPVLRIAAPHSEIST